MKAAFLPGIFIVLTVFGYFTVGRWLMRSSFSLPPRPPTDAERVPVSPVVALALHAGTLPGLITLGSVLIALYWGWTPAYVWLLVGTTVFGLVYFVGTRYWSNFISASAPLAQFEETGGQAVRCGHVLIIVTLLVTAAMLVALFALLMAANPGLVAALLAAYPAWYCFRSSCLATGNFAVRDLGWGLACLLCLSAGIAAASYLSGVITSWQPGPTAFAGGALASPLTWLGCLVIGILGFSARTESTEESTLNSLAIFSGLLFLALMMLLAIGLLLSNADIVLPTHTVDETIPSFLWLFLLIFAGGAMNAARGMVVLERGYLEGGAARHRLHFAGYALDALFAVLVLAIVGSYTTVENPVFETWPGQPDIAFLLAHGRDALSTVLLALGMPKNPANTIILFVLQLAALTFALQLLQSSRRMVEQSGLVPVNTAAFGQYGPAAVISLAAMMLAVFEPGYGGWLLLGLLNVLAVAVLMFYVTWTLVRNQQQFIPSLIPAVIIACAALSQGLVAISTWISGGHWGIALFAGLVVVGASIPLLALFRLFIPALGQSRSSLDLFDRE